MQRWKFKLPESNHSEILSCSLKRTGLGLFRNKGPLQYSEVISIICLSSVNLLCAKPAISEVWLSGQRTENTNRAITGLWLPSMLSHFTRYWQFSNLNFPWETSPFSVLIRVAWVRPTPACPKYEWRRLTSISGFNL